MSRFTPTDEEIPPPSGPEDEEYDALLNIDPYDTDSDIEYFSDRAASRYERDFLGWD